LEFFFQEENRVLWQKKIDYILDYLVKYEMAIAPDLQDVFTELSCNFSIKNTNISGKIDRINIFTDHIEIIDYKTGTIAQKQEIQNGLEPQLVVSLIAFIKQFGAEKISDKKNSLFYKILKIKEIKENEVKKEFFKKEDEIGNLKQEAQIGLEGLIDIFDNNQKFYPCPNEEIYKKNDYQHLERKG
jgi:ATP-dependent helicase/nuclease subunit B